MGQPIPQQVTCQAMPYEIMSFYPQSPRGETGLTLSLGLTLIRRDGPAPPLKSATRRDKWRTQRKICTIKNGRLPALPRPNLPETYRHINTTSSTYNFTKPASFMWRK